MAIHPRSQLASGKAVPHGRNEKRHAGHRIVMLKLTSGNARLMVISSYTTCLTYTSPKSAQGALVVRGSGGIFDLEEPLQPPDLEDAFPNHHAHLEDRPPLHTCIGRFGGIAVRALADHDVALFVFYLGEEVGELFYCGIKTYQHCPRPSITNGGGVQACLLSPTDLA